MEYAVSVLMLAFAGMLLIYAAILFITKDPLLIPKHYAVNMKDERNYARQLGKAVAVVAAAPAAAGLVGFLFGNTALVIVLAAGLVLCIWAAVRIMHNEVEWNTEENDEL